MQISESISDQEIIFSMNYQPKELEEDDNSDEDDTSEEIGSVFNVVKMRLNYLALNNVSSKRNFETIWQKNTAWFSYKQSKN